MDIKTAFRTDAWNDVREILKEDYFGMYQERLIKELKQNGNSTVAVFDDLFTYACSRVPSRDQCPDKELSSFFYVLSELRDIDDERRSKATDCMVYCETDQYDYIGSMQFF